MRSSDTRARTVKVIFHLRAYQKNKPYWDLIQLLSRGDATDSDIEKLLRKFKHAWVIEHWRSKPRKKRT